MALSSPIYEQPLTDEQMIVLARITLLWAHVDTQIDGLLKNLYALEGPAFDRLFGQKTIGEAPPPDRNRRQYFTDCKPDQVETPWPEKLCR